MKPELKVLTPKDAPKPQGQEELTPSQGEMPFAVVDGEPVTELPRTSTSRHTPCRYSWRHSRDRSICCCI